jgi:hypothetical protein
MGDIYNVMYAVNMNSTAMIYVYTPSFVNIGSATQKLSKVYTDTLLYERRLKI